MLIRQLFPVLLLLSSGCSAQTPTLVSQPAVQSANPAAETSIAPLSPSRKYAEQSSQAVVLAGLGNAMKSLDTYKWKNRLLLVFAPSEKSAAYKRQMQLLVEQKAGLEDRDLRVVQLFAESTSYLDSQLIDEATAAQFRSQFNVGQEEVDLIPNFLNINGLFFTFQPRLNHRS